jgi:hypothetical protein
MLTEEDVPASGRQLLIEGRVSAKTLAAIRAGLPLAWPSTARCLFASYAYADLPLGKRFDAIFPCEHPENAEPTVAMIVGVTQQFGKPFEGVPHGWKTICLLDFPEGEPAVVADLPTVDAWGESKACVSLCTRETLDSIKRSTDA